VSRLNDKEKGPVVVVMQCLHENDLAGHLREHDGWHHLDLPAIAVEDSVIEVGQEKRITRHRGEVLHPERESKAALDRIKAEIGSLTFSVQYQQRSVPLEGNLIRRDWFRCHVGQQGLRSCVADPLGSSARWCRRKSRWPPPSSWRPNHPD